MCGGQQRIMTKELFLETVVPKLQSGIEQGHVTLNAADCKALVLVLNQSVDIEALVTCFHKLIGQALIPMVREDKEG